MCARVHLKWALGAIEFVSREIFFSFSFIYSLLVECVEMMKRANNDDEAPSGSKCVHLA